MIMLIIAIALYALAAWFTAHTFGVIAFASPLMGKRDPFRGEPTAARRFVLVLLGIAWPFAALYLLTMGRRVDANALPDTRSASRVRRRELKKRAG